MKNSMLHSRGAIVMAMALVAPLLTILIAPAPAQAQDQEIIPYVLDLEDDDGRPFATGYMWVGPREPGDQAYTKVVASCTGCITGWIESVETNRWGQVKTYRDYMVTAYGDNVGGAVEAEQTYYGPNQQKLRACFTVETTTKCMPWHLSTVPANAGPLATGSAGVGTTFQRREVQRYYRDFLGVEPTASAVGYWSGTSNGSPFAGCDGVTFTHAAWAITSSNNAAQLIDTLFPAPDLSGLTSGQRNTVLADHSRRLIHHTYSALLDRPPSSGELHHFMNVQPVTDGYSTGHIVYRHLVPLRAEFVSRINSGCANG